MARLAVFRSDVVKLEDFQFSVFNAELFENLGNLLMLLGAGHGDQLVSVAIDRKVNANALALEHIGEDAFGRIAVDVFQVVEFQPVGGVELGALFDLGNQFRDLLVLDRRGVSNEAVVRIVDRELHVVFAAEEIGENLQHARWIGRSDLVDLESGRHLDRVAVHLLDGLADLLVILG